MDVCLRVLKESNKSRFDSYSVRNSVLIIFHISFRVCNVHIFSDNISRNSCISLLYLQFHELYFFPLLARIAWLAGSQIVRPPKTDSILRHKGPLKSSFDANMTMNDIELYLSTHTGPYGFKNFKTFFFDLVQEYLHVPAQGEAPFL